MTTLGRGVELTSARGRVPLTPLRRGELVCFDQPDWRTEDGQLHLAAETPEGIPIVVVLPGGQREEFPGGSIRLVTDRPTGP